MRWSEMIQGSVGRGGWGMAGVAMAGGLCGGVGDGVAATGEAGGIVAGGVAAAGEASDGVACGVALVRPVPKGTEFVGRT